MFRHIEQTAQLSGVDAYLSADVFGEHGAADKTMAETTPRVKAKRRMLVAVFVTLRIDAGTMQPLAILSEALGVEMLRQGLHHMWIEVVVAGR